MEETSKHGVVGRHQICSKEWVEVLSDAIERNTLPAYCIPKVVRMETEEIIFERVFETPRLPPKISLRHHWMKDFGPEVASTSRSQPTHQNSNPIYRTGRPVVIEPTSRSSAQEIDTRFSLDCNNTNLFERLEKDKDTDRRRRRRCCS